MGDAEKIVVLEDSPNVVVQDSTPPTEVADEELEIDIDDLKSKLGLDKILVAIDSLSNAVTKRKPDNEPEAQDTQAKRAKLAAEEFDPCSPLVVSEVVTDKQDNKEEFVLPSIFEEADSFGPSVNEMLAKRANAACITKPVDGKIKDLEAKYKTPQNCQFLGVPKVNMELWLDLQKNVKVKDLAFQEIQKFVVKGSQALVVALDKIIQAQNKRVNIEPSTILTELGDSLAFLGHACYQTSLKRRDSLRPHINKHYQSVCSKNTPISKWLFGDDLAKSIKDIGEVNKMSRKVGQQFVARPKDKRSDNRRSDNFSQDKQNTFLSFRRRGGRKFGYDRSSSNNAGSSQTLKSLKDKA